MAVTSLAAPGREVIVIEPSFVLFQPLVGLAGGSVRRIVTTAEKGYQVDPQEVIDAMGPRTCAVILNSPGNPTGGRLSRLDRSRPSVRPPPGGA